MTSGQSSIRAVDSLSANEFAVEVDGELVTGAFGVKGLCSLSLVDGQPVFPPLTIAKMVERDTKLATNRWIRETLENPTARVTRKLAVVALDDGVEVRRWVYRGAWISEVAYSDFDASSEMLVEERLTIQHQGVEVVWAAD